MSKQRRQDEGELDETLPAIVLERA